MNRDIKPLYYESKREMNGRQISCRELIAEMTGNCEGIEGFYMGSVVKYLWRYRDKNNPAQDLLKARTYMVFLRDIVKRKGIEKPGVNPLPHELASVLGFNGSFSGISVCDWLWMSVSVTASDEKTRCLNRAISALDDFIVEYKTNERTKEAVNDEDETY